MKTETITKSFVFVDPLTDDGSINVTPEYYTITISQDFKIEDDYQQAYGDYGPWLIANTSADPIPHTMQVSWDRDNIPSHVVAMFNAISNKLEDSILD